ncbi:patatin-like protein 3 [Carex rostrata]
MATTTASPPPPSSILDPSFDVDKLSYEIFSILESKFLFGYDDPKLFLPSLPPTPTYSPSPLTTPRNRPSPGKVCILSIDGGGRAADGLLAGAALARLESSLRTRSGDPSVRISDFFDVLAGSGAGGVLACMLSARSPHGRPLFSAEEALQFLIKNLKKTWSKKRKGLIFRNSSGRVKSFKKLFGEMTLKDTVRPVLVPCYDLTTGSAFLFSRADAIENEGYDFKVREVCEATCCDGIDGGIEAKSVDGKRRVVAVGGGVTMGNPTAAAITHVLNNKKEFPLAGGVDDLLVVSIGSSDAGCPKAAGEASEGEIVRIAAEGVADMVDQAVAMAFGRSRASNYIRIQASGPSLAKSKMANSSFSDIKKVVGEAEDMLSQRNIESVLFRGKKLADQTNAEKLEWFAHELMKEHDRRKASPLPTVLVKQQPTTPRQPMTPTTPTTATTSAATTPARTAANTPVRTAATTPARTAASSPSYSNLVGQMLTTIL